MRLVRILKQSLQPRVLFPFLAMTGMFFWSIFTQVSVFTAGFSVLGAGFASWGFLSSYEYFSYLLTGLEKLVEGSDKALKDLGEKTQTLSKNTETLNQTNQSIAAAAPEIQGATETIEDLNESIIEAKEALEKAAEATQATTSTLQTIEQRIAGLEKTFTTFNKSTKDANKLKSNQAQTSRAKPKKPPIKFDTTEEALNQTFERIRKLKEARKKKATAKKR